MTREEIQEQIDNLKSEVATLSEELDFKRELIEDLRLRHEDDKSMINQLRILLNEQPKESDWVPCETRLPDKSGNYLVTREQMLESVTDFYFKRREQFSYDYGNRVIAWRELPDPYKPI